MDVNEMVSYIEGKENGKNSAMKLSNIHSTNALHSTYKKSIKPQIKTPGPSLRDTATRNSKEKCSYCNTYGHGDHRGMGSAHVRKRLGCPAFGKQCNKCSKYNHFSIVCRTNEQGHTTAAIEDDHTVEEHIVGGAIGIHQD